jgi:outer membrane immunogenic protein
MRQWLLAGVSLTALFTTTAAWAADIPVAARQPAPVAYQPPWAGVYLGLFAGGHWSRDRWTSDDPDDANDFSPFNIKPRGFSGGALIGANVQQGNFVWGPELDIGWLTGSGTLNVAALAGAEIDSVESRPRWNAHARLRFGYAAGQVLPFIAGGAAFSNTKITFRDSVPGGAGTGAPIETRSIDRVGFTLGGGVDWMFARNWIGRVEYLYDQYVPASFGLLLRESAETFDLRSHIVRAALMYKFDEGVPAGSSPGGLITKAPPVAYPATWSGVYGGLFAGGHWSRDRWSSDESDPAALLDGVDLKPNGFSGGALLGANFQQGNLVWGPEIDIGWLTGSATLDATGFPDTGNRFEAVKTQMRWNAHARVRFGYATGQALPFIAAGVAFASTRITFNETDQSAPGIVETKRLDRAGVTIGGGVDWMFARNWIGRVEYLYDHYASAGFGSLQQGDVEIFQLRSSTVRGAVLYKFDGGVPARPVQTGLVTKAPPVAYPAPWSGVYAGLFAGGHWSRDIWNSDETEPAADLGPLGLRPRGFSGGALVGANVQNGHLVWGAELDAGWLTGSSRLDFGISNLGDGIDAVETKTRWNAHARVRFGYAADQFLPFIAGGMAFANTRLTFLDSTVDPGEPPVLQTSLNRFGVTLGGGVDWMFARNWIGRVEYLYDIYAPSSFGSMPQHSNTEFFELRSNTVRGAIIYKWNSDRVAARY